jgi:hypothetical protein
MTDSHAPSDDDALLAALRQAVAAADPVPDDWHEAAGSSFAWAAIDAEPATLAYDSCSTVGPPGAVLTGPVVRELRFTSGPLSIELDVQVSGDTLRVLGRVTPGRSVEVLALWPEGKTDVTSDDGGRFRFDELPGRPLCVVVGGERPVKTGWVVP